MGLASCGPAGDSASPGLALLTNRASMSRIVPYANRMPPTNDRNWGVGMPEASSGVIVTSLTVSSKSRPLTYILIGIHATKQKPQTLFGGKEPAVTIGFVRRGNDHTAHRGDCGRRQNVGDHALRFSCALFWMSRASCCRLRCALPSAPYALYSMVRFALCTLHFALYPMAAAAAC